MDKRYETFLVILACFSIGMGAALTPIGEPLSTIAIAKLKGGRYNADSLFMLHTIGSYITSGLILISTAGLLLRGNGVNNHESLSEDYPEPLKIIGLRA
jgi:predicted cation transporter